MNVLIVNPSRFYVGWGSGELSHLFALHGYVRKHCPGVEVGLLDLGQELGYPTAPPAIAAFLADARRLLARAAFDLVGISCYTTLHYPSAVAIARLCKELNPACTVVVGGHHPTAVPEDFDLPDKPVDFVVRGDGELALQRIVAGRIAREVVPQVVQGQALPVEERVLAWDTHKYLPQIKVMMVQPSRRYPDGTWQAIPPPRLVADLQRAVAALPQLRVICFVDPEFGRQKPWRDEFLALLRRADLPVAYVAQVPLADVDRDLTDGAAGLRLRVDLDLGSVVPEMLAIMQRTDDPARYLRDFREATDLLNERQVPHVIGLTLNHPGETNRTLDATASYWRLHYLQRERHHSYLGAHALRYFPGGRPWEDWPQLQAQHGCRLLAPGWWRQPPRADEANAYIIASGELAESRQLGRPAELARQLQQVSQAGMAPRIFEPFMMPPTPLAWADAWLTTSRGIAYFDDKPLKLSGRAYAYTRENGDLVLYHFLSSKYFHCTAGAAALVRALLDDRRTIGELLEADRQADGSGLRDLVLDLVTNDMLVIDVHPPTAAAPPPGPVRALLRTMLGEIELELFPDEAPELVVNFLQLARARVYDSLYFWSTQPVDWVEIGTYAGGGQGPDYTLPLQVTPRPLCRGAMAQVNLRNVLHSSRFRIARSDRLAGDGPQPVFGQVIRGWDVLDSLLNGSVLQEVSVSQ